MSNLKNNIPIGSFLDFDLYLKPDTISNEIKNDVSEAFEGVVIITNIDTNSKESQTNYIQFLSKICDAAGLEIGANTLHLNIISGNGILFNEIQKNLTLKKLIVFGPTPRELGIHLKISPYQRVNWEEIDFIFADSIEKIHEDINKKMLLWGLLKQLFLT